MLVAAAVVPGAPALVPELMGAAAGELDEVRAAACRAVESVLARLVDPHGAPIGRLVVVGAADPGAEAPSRSHDLAGALADRSFGPSLRLPELPGARPPLPGARGGTKGETRGESASEEALVPTPLLVARWLAGDVAASKPEVRDLWAETLWVTVTPEAAADYGRTLDHDLAPVGLVLVADGAACHGPKAPRREDERAGAYDESVCAALGSGDPAAVAALDAGLGRELSAEGAGLWPLLASASRGARWRAELRWRGSPYGVGWFVADWQRDLA